LKKWRLEVVVISYALQIIIYKSCEYNFVAFQKYKGAEIFFSRKKSHGVVSPFTGLESSAQNIENSVITLVIKHCLCRFCWAIEWIFIKFTYWLYIIKIFNNIGFVQLCTIECALAKQIKWNERIYWCRYVVHAVDKSLNWLLW
jgi:hypothetical protein